MQIAPVEINLKLINEKVKFEVVSASRPNEPVTIDYLPPLGDGEGFLGLELLTMSFAGCVSTAIVALLRRLDKPIAGYKMSVTGHKREMPLSLEKIDFSITFESDSITAEEVEKVLLQAEQISPVWIAIKNNVAVEYQYHIIK